MTLTVPALTADTTVGFLAAVGLLDLLTRRDADATLSWSHGRPHAQVNAAGATTVEQLVDLVHDIAVHADTLRLPGADTSPLPSPTKAGKGDTLRGLLNDDQRAAFREAQRLAFAGDTTASRELASIASAHQRPETRSGQPKLTPLYLVGRNASLGAQTAKRLRQVVEDPKLLAEAFTGWVRHEGDTGDYFDYAAMSNAATEGIGKAVKRGVPGVTWLAHHARLVLPSLGPRPGQTVGWHPLRRDRRLEHVLVWAVWHRPLTVEGIAALLSLPQLRPTWDGPSLRLIAKPTWAAALKVSTVFAAQRESVREEHNAKVLSAAQPVALL